jgi:hypothetical protein
VTLRRTLRIALVDAIVAVVALLLFPVFLSARAGDNQIVEAQPMDYALLVVASVFIASGVQLTLLGRARYVVFLSVLAGAGLLFGILGAFAGYGAVLLYIALIVPATVECRVNGGGTSSGRWGGAGVQQISATGSVTPDGVVTGRIETSTSVATFRCEQGKIVEFRRESK